MPVYDTYSKRKRRAESNEPDVYQYDEIPEQLRMQICYLLEAALGIGKDRRNNDRWFFVLDTLRREYGLSYVAHKDVDPRQFCIHRILIQTEIDTWLDVVELCFVSVDRARAFDAPHQLIYQIRLNPDDAVNELNFRFREAGLGYQFENGQIIRVDAQLVHSEVVKPALTLLADPSFKGPQDEFLSAHAHYRAAEYEDAIVDANRAFESTMKTICDINGWEYTAGGRASDLIKVIRDNGLLPGYLDQSFDQLIATLKSGLPKVRNEAGGHGQGPAPRKTPGYVAGYALHLAAANIVLLVEAFKGSE